MTLVLRRWTGSEFKPTLPASAYPDATNTGIQPGKTLLRIPDDIASDTGWIWDDRGWVTISEDGTVFDSYEIGAGVNVEANNVVMSNCRISFAGPGGDNFGVSLRHAVNPTVKYCEISGPNPEGGLDDDRLTACIKDIYFDCTGTQILYNNLYDCSCGAQMDSGYLYGNYIHNLAANDTDHTNCLLSSDGGTELMWIKHNTLLNQLGQNSAIALYEDNAGHQHDKTVEDNILGGGGYVLYCGGGDHGGWASPENMKFKNNKFTTTLFANGGEIGIAAYPVPLDADGFEWSGNVWLDGPDVGDEIVAPT